METRLTISHSLHYTDFAENNWGAPKHVTQIEMGRVGIEPYTQEYKLSSNNPSIDINLGWLDNNDIKLECIYVSNKSESNIYLTNQDDTITFTYFPPGTAGWVFVGHRNTKEYKISLQSGEGEILSTEENFPQAKVVVSLIAKSLIDKLQIEKTDD